MQRKAVYLLFCKFTLNVSGAKPHPSSGVHKTVTRASGTGHIFCAATSLQHSQASSATLEAVVTVLCTPDDGCGLTPETCIVKLQNNK